MFEDAHVTLKYHEFHVFCVKFEADSDHHNNRKDFLENEQVDNAWKLLLAKRV